MLEVRDVVKVYPAVGEEPVRAIDGVSFDVARGELVALYGPSGSGKTTLLELIARVLRPDSGTVYVGGRDIAGLQGREIDRYRLEQLGLVLQSTRLIAGLTVLENAAMRLMERGSRWGEAKEQVIPLLGRLDLGGRLRHRPGQLSAGERQRVAIAMALSTGPGLVLADEPTGTLDSRRARVVLDLLAEVCRERGTATLITTHDPTAASVADRAWALHDGRLVDHEPDAPPAPARAG